MSGSGNDFVIFDVRNRGDIADALERTEAIQALTERRTGVGADGVVFVEESGRPGAALAMRYYNCDGSRVAFCGNATLCVTRLAAELGMAPHTGFALETDSGVVQVRVGPLGPEFDFPPVTEVSATAAVPLEPGEQRMGFALVGVPHLVIRVENVDDAPVESRGRELRYSSFRADGVNVNFVAKRPDGWAMRTYERGVESETLACGSGSIACAIVLASWGESGAETPVITRSGCLLTVRLEREREGWKPRLSGEGRIVFTGEIAELGL